MVEVLHPQPDHDLTRPAPRPETAAPRAGERFGEAAFATEATRVTEEMFLIAAQAVSEQVTEENLSIGLIYPPQSQILEASLHVAERIAACIFDQGLAGVPRPDDIGALIRTRIYRPAYLE